MKTFQNRQLGASEKIKDSYQKINLNADELSVDLSDLYNQDATTTTRINNHVQGLAELHGSDDITNESTVIGTNVSVALNTVQQQVNALVVGGTPNTTIGVYSLTAGGSANAYTGTFAGATLFGGLKVNATFNTTNTGASTFNFNSTGVKAIKVVLATGSKSDLKGGELYGKVLMEYDGTDFVVVEKNFLNGGTSSTAVTVTQPITSLPSSVVKSRADWKIEGNAIYQAVVNGDFSNGTTGWSAYVSTLSVTSKVLTVTGTGADRVPKAFINSLTTGQKIFAKAKVRVTNSLAQSVSLITGSNQVFATQNSPILNQYYDIYGIVNSVSSTSIEIASLYADAATANGKAMEVQEVMAIPLTGTPYESYTADQMNALVTMYFEGLQGVKDVRVKSVGKNLFDKNSGLLNVTSGSSFAQNETGITVSALTNGTFRQARILLKLKPNGQYKFKCNSARVSGATSGGGVLIQNKERTLTIAGSVNTLNPDLTFTAPSNGFVEIQFYCTGTTIEGGIVNFTNIMLNEGSTALPYEPYTETETYLPVTLNKLPNGVADSVDDDGVFVKRVQEYTLQAGDVASIISYTNIQRVRVSLLSYGIKSQIEGVIDGNTIVTGFVERVNESAGFDVATSAYGYGTETTNLYLFVPLGTYANLADAQAALAGTKILYQLATPITQQLQVPNLIAEPSGTIYVDNIYSDVDFYGTNITVVGRTFSTIEKVLKIDKDTGAETDITSTCTLTAGKDGFTSTSLLSGDLAWFELVPTGTMIPSLTYSYAMDIKAAVEGNTKAIQQIDDQITEFNEINLQTNTNLDISRFAKTDTGTANAYVVDTNGRFERINGNTFSFIPANTNTGASTINEDGNGAIAIEKYNIYTASWVALEAEDLRKFNLATVSWNASRTAFQLAPKGGSNIRTIQRGQGTFTSGVATVDVTISSVDMAKSIIIPHQYGQTTTANQALIRVAFVNSTTIRFTLNTATTTVTSIMFSYQVIEFNNVKLKQSGQRSSFSGQVNVTITAVNLAKTMLITSHTSSQTTATIEPAALNAYLTSATNLQLSALGTGTIVEWQIIEFN